LTDSGFVDSLLIFLFISVMYFRALFDGVLASLLFAVALMQAPTKNTKRKKRKKRKVSQMSDIVSASAMFVVEPVEPIHKRPRVIQESLPSRFCAGDDVHYDVSLSDRPTLFVESDEDGPVYIVPRNTGTQMYIARHLASRHTVRKLSYLDGYLLTLPPQTPIRYYCPEEDHEDDFFIVLNKEESTRELSSFPFQQLQTYSLGNGSEGASQVERQSEKLNRGFTSSMSMGSRARNGVPRPALKDGSLDDVVVTSHLCATRILTDHPLPWLGRTLNWDPQRLQFARIISPDNKVEGSTFTVSTDCAWHRDVHNPNPPMDDLSWVMNVNHTFEPGVTVTSLFYQRSSVCSYLRASNVHNPVSDFFSTSFLKFPPCRRSFSRLTVLEADFVGSQLDRDGFLCRKANLDTLGYHNLFLVTWMTLVDRLKLNLLEAVSCFVSILFFPNTSEPFARAAVELLKSGQQTRCPRGFDVGLELLKSMVVKHSDRKFPLRFNTYRPANVPSTNAYFGHCRLVFWTCIHVWATHSTRPSNTHIYGVYKKIKLLFQELPGVGDLISMHGVQMLAEMGLLPPWLQTFAAFNHSGKVYGWLVTQFGLGKTRCDAKKLMLTLKASLVVSIGPCVNEVIIENLGCKAFQLESPHGRCVYDVHHRRAPVVQRRDDGNGLVLLLMDSDCVDLENGCLMSRWPFGDDNLSMKEISKRLGSATAMKSIKGLLERPMPVEVQIRLKSSPVPYQIPNWY
jgi:hypothetical protein